MMLMLVHRKYSTSASDNFVSWLTMSYLLGVNALQTKLKGAMTDLWSAQMENFSDLPVLYFSKKNPIYMTDLLGHSEHLL